MIVRVQVLGQDVRTLTSRRGLINGLPFGELTEKAASATTEQDGDDLHPMQEAWLEHDVPQCGFCQPGQIMAAVAKVRQCRDEGRDVDDEAIEEIRNICRCGTCNRIREAIKSGADEM